VAGNGACVLAGAVVLAFAAAACTASPAYPGGHGHSPPPLQVLTHRQGSASSGDDIFLAPAGGGYRAGPEIISTTGRVIWFHVLPAGQGAADFRTQTYRGKPVLTWCQIDDPRRMGGLLPAVTDHIYSDRYRQIATVRAGNGFTASWHEFVITPWNTVLIVANKIATANLAARGGPADQKVIDGVVQEINIATGKVLFQWNSAGHVPYQDSHQPLPPSAGIPWDWFHINAVHLDTDGNLLVSSRFTWTTYKVNRRTGAIIWELGGKQSSFRLRAAPGQDLDNAGEIFAFQHDPEAIGHNEYTLFDDESAPLLGQHLPYSRVVTVKLNLATKVATLVSSADQPEHLLAGAMGNAQTTSNGNLFVGWGTLPYISEFSPSGRLLFNAELPPGVSTYRAYLLPWHPA
jgi:arylsulfotransferase ASST